MGMAAGLLGTGASMAGSLMGADAQRKAQAQQQQNNQNWMLGQMALRNQEMLRQRQFGFNAAQDFRQNLYDNTGGLAQASQQQKEQARLENAYAGGTSASEYATPASDASIQAGSQRGALTGQSGGDGEFRTDLARRLNNAAQNSREKIAALATMNSYGDSQFGLGNFVARANQETAQRLNQWNNFRRGSLNAYGVEKAIEPTRVDYKKPTGQTVAEGAGGLLSGLGKMGGNFGGMF
jgi:hypothetical protein